MRRGPTSQDGASAEDASRVFGVGGDSVGWVCGGGFGGPPPENFHLEIAEIELIKHEGHLSLLEDHAYEKYRLPHGLYLGTEM